MDRLHQQLEITEVWGKAGLCFARFSHDHKRPWSRDVTSPGFSGRLELEAVASSPRQLELGSRRASLCGSRTVLGPRGQQARPSRSSLPNELRPPSLSQPSRNFRPSPRPCLAMFNVGLRTYRVLGVSWGSQCLNSRQLTFPFLH